MGLCVSNGIKCYTRSTELNSRNVRRDGKNLGFEFEILQSPNLKNFSFSELKIATRNFRSDGVLGEDGFGPVFKGRIDGMVIAVKRLNHEGFLGQAEWLAEINYLGKLQHPNLVKLIGYCFEDDHRLLVCEFMSCGSMEKHLFRRGSELLSWDIRMKIALGAAKGLAILHSADVNVIHRDFKTSHILLDSNYNAKLSGFALARDGPTDDKSYVSTRVMGTQGFAAPEYLATGRLNAKCDVFSFGVVLLEILSGRRAIERTAPPEQHNLVEWAKPYLTNRRRVLRVLDTRLGGQHFLKRARKLANLALHCLNDDPRLRPDMDEVVMALESLQESN
ncbi:hypothetical protein JCGZ_01558 [Jatropha curcas]|uniref:non-specific serine/threonine protein kinase n=1 Tax=Jatropha curcas TaxID=180498 RepID=A0A067LCT8_JATCU|nr:hypothetical protein JCGZ_01558 [Jatropha curcas]